MSLFMRKLIAILLTISILGGVTHMDEMVKIPMLFKHFFEHKAIHQKDTALTFLFKHYISVKKADSDRDKNSNSQLPFKSTKKLVSHYFPLFFENNSVQYELISFVKLYVIFQTVDTITGFSAIWQPPKIT